MAFRNSVAGERTNLEPTLPQVAEGGRPKKVVRSERLELSRVLPHSDLNAARLPFRHDRTPWMVRSRLAKVAGVVKGQSATKNPRGDGAPGAFAKGLECGPIR